HRLLRSRRISSRSGAGMSRQRSEPYSALMKNRERGSENRGAAGWGMRGAVEGDHKKRTGRAPVLVDYRRRIEPRANRSSRLGESGSVRLHVVAVDVLLIAEVEASVRDHRMRPDRSARASTLAFRIE